jgi:3-isopropylmalate dehydrogenase
MALRYSLDLDNEADALEKAVQDVLNDGLRTKDYFVRWYERGINI